MWKEFKLLWYSLAAMFGLALSSIIILAIEVRKGNESQRSTGRITTGLLLFSAAFMTTVMLLIGYWSSQS